MEARTSPKRQRTGSPSREACRTCREMMHTNLDAKRTSEVPPFFRRNDLLDEGVSSERDEYAYQVHKSGMSQPGHVVTCTSNNASHDAIALPRVVPIYRPTLERESKRQKRYTFVKDPNTHLGSSAGICKEHTQLYFQDPSLENGTTEKDQMVYHLYHTSLWKGLTPDEASDIARLEATFSDVLESIIDEYLRDILPATATPHLHLGTYTIPIYLGTVVVRMLHELGTHPVSSWAIALGDIRSTLVKFICLHDLFWSTPPSGKPNLLMTTIRLVVAESPFNTKLNHSPSMQMLPISTPDYIKLEGQIPSPVNEGRQIIVIPHYVSPILGISGAVTTSDREITFISRTSWLKWNDLLRSFVGIVPFRFSHEDQDVTDKDAQSIYASCVEIEGTCTVKFGSVAVFQRKVTCQMELRVRPRVMFQDAGTSNFPEYLAVEEVLADMRCAEINGSSIAEHRRNMLRQHEPRSTRREECDVTLQDGTHRAMSNVPLETGMRFDNHTSNGPVGTIESDTALLNSDMISGGLHLSANFARGLKEDEMDRYTQQILNARHSPQYFQVSSPALGPISPNQRFAVKGSFDYQSNSEESVAQSNISPQISPQRNGGDQAISPTRTIRNQTGKVWTIDDSYLIKERDKGRFFEMLRSLPHNEVPRSPVLEAQVDSLESPSPISSIDSGRNGDEAAK